MRSHKLTLKLTLTAAAVVVVSLFTSVSKAGEWPAHLAKISKYKSETTSLEGEVKHLLEAKKHAHSEGEVRELTLQIADRYKALKTAAEKLETEVTHVRFKHPEQADQLERKYTRYQMKSLDDLASEVGIDGRLDRIKRQVAEIFPTGEAKVAEKPAPKVSPLLRMPASVVVDEDAPEKIVLKK